MNEVNENLVDKEFLATFRKLFNQYVQEKRLKVSGDDYEDYKQNDIITEAMNIEKFYHWMIELN